MSKPPAAVIGLGHLGVAVAERLATEGHCVVGYDVDPKRPEIPGVERASSAAEAVERSNGNAIVLVRTGEQAEQVTGEIAKSGRLIVVLSTLGPSGVERLADRIAGQDVDIVDAPVSGAPTRALSGTMTVMLAGAERARARALPLLESIGNDIHVLGDRPGQGQAMKLVNQLMMFSSLYGIREATRLADAFGISFSKAREIVTTCTGNSYILHQPLDEFALPSSLEIIMKDLGAILDAGESRSVNLPLAQQVMTLVSAQYNNERGCR